MVLGWFDRAKNNDGIVGHIRYWDRIDWLQKWKNGNPAGESGKPLTINSLVLIEALKTAAALAKFANPQKENE